MINFEFYEHRWDDLLKARKPRQVYSLASPRVATNFDQIEMESILNTKTPIIQKKKKKKEKNFHDRTW